MTRRKNETAEEKENRLKRDRENKRKRQADETEEQRQTGLERERQSMRRNREAAKAQENLQNHKIVISSKMTRRKNEMVEEKENRLKRDRENKRKRQADETEEQRQTRLERERQRMRRNREAAKAQGNLQDHEDEVLRNEFEQKMQDLKISVCSICKRQKLSFSVENACDKCSKKLSPNLYTCDNRMDPGIVPQELLDLTPLEELLIAKVHPVLSVYKTKGQQLHYEGHVINFPQDVRSFSKRLPNVQAATTSIITVRETGQVGDKSHSDFRVRGCKVRNALLWLKQNNEYYGDIDIDEKAIQTLPEDGILRDIQCIESENVNFDVNDDAEGMFYTTNVPNLPLQNQVEMITKALDGRVDWPEINDAPIDEFRTAGYIACAFPTLFPYGDADLRQGRLKRIGESDYFKFLMSYSDGRFAKHPRFPFFAMNSTLRWSAQNQGKVFEEEERMQRIEMELYEVDEADQIEDNFIKQEVEFTVRTLIDGVINIEESQAPKQGRTKKLMVHAKRMSTRVRRPRLLG